MRIYIYIYYTTKCERYNDIYIYCILYDLMKFDVRSVYKSICSSTYIYVYIYIHIYTITDGAARSLPESQPSVWIVEGSPGHVQA